MAHNQRSPHGRVRIYQPTKTAMQSGKGNTQQWRLEFEDSGQKPVEFIEPLMGWTGTNDTRPQLRQQLRFPTKEAAIAYAVRHNLAYRVCEPEERHTIIKSYADNFKWKTAE